MKAKMTWPSGLVQLILAFLLAVGLSGASFRSIEAQAGPEMEWDEGILVTAEGNSDEFAELMAAPTAPGTMYRSYSGTAFTPTASTMTYAPIGSAVYVTAIPAGGYSLSYELSLPHGAAITEVVFYLVDNHMENFSLSLRSYNDMGFLQIRASGTSSRASGAIQTIIIPVDPPVVVDNTTSTYRLRVVPGVANSNHLLYGARVGYTVPLNFLPMIDR